ncbi:MAG: hypothetical protein J4F35_15420 [Candidatus Latescibacteria bacterium]|nr:hypothetical protein [Candidatus Latescibacterota bacterium]
MPARQEINTYPPERLKPSVLGDFLWDYRRAAFERMAQRLGGIAEERFAEVFAGRLK